MEISLLLPDDLPELERIHQKFYADEFAFPFRGGERKLLEKYIVKEDGKIITFGAIELSAEVLAITNKEADVKLRRQALYTLFQALMFNAGKYNFPMLHCVVIDDPEWERHLKKVGWRDCSGKFLFHKVE